MAERDLIWSSGGLPVEYLPAPFTPEAPLQDHGQPAPQEQLPARRRRWPVVLYAISSVIFLTLIWLVVTAPLSRALEPLDDPALLFLSDDGHPIARRGAIKEAPVDVEKLNPLTPAAFVAIEDRRFYGTPAGSAGRCSPTCAAAAFVRAAARSRSN